MFKVGLLGFKSGVIPLQTFLTRELADEYILSIVAKEGIRTGYLLNTETKEREKLEEMR
jgi:hypothetical protein